MNLAMVKHPRCTKNYWFHIPDGLVSVVKTGAAVICDTRRGTQIGIVVSMFQYDGNDAVVRALLEQNGATFPLRKIIAVYGAMPISKIVIPDRMRHTTPRDKKVAARCLEWYQFGHFQTEVVVNQNFVLSDGYSAYFVAKELGHKTIRVRVEVNCK